MFRRLINRLLGRVDFGPFGILQLNPTTGRFEPLTQADLDLMEADVFEYHEERALACYGPSILRYQ
jgi:hypothetical protein